MRVMQATAWYPPLHVGGTEIYLAGLVDALGQMGVTNVVAAPLAPEVADASCHEGARLRTYIVAEASSRAELRGSVPHAGFDLFEKILKEERCAIYHQHSWTRGMGKWHLRAARAAGMRTLVTLHTPSPLCLVGTMMRNGAEPCMGPVDARMCAACWSQRRGAGPLQARTLASMPATLSAAVGTLMPPGRTATAIAARALAETHARDLHDMAACSDRIVVVCQWLREALIARGVAADRIVLSRQGLDARFATAAGRRDRIARPDDAPFRLLAIGRWHFTKGFDVLVEAVRSLPPQVRVELDIHAVAGDAEAEATRRSVVAAAMGDPRITFKPPLGRAELVDALAAADALAVPSVWFETGPLVVLEAQAMGVPVIGSRLGGIAELVHEGEDGVLVAAGDVDAWRRAILTAVGGGLPPARRRGDVRTMTDVAHEMIALYRGLI